MVPKDLTTEDVDSMGDDEILQIFDELYRDMGVTDRRSYSGLDLIRFHDFANQNPDMSPVEWFGAYKKKYPKLTNKQKLLNLIKLSSEE